MLSFVAREERGIWHRCQNRQRAYPNLLPSPLFDAPTTSPTSPPPPPLRPPNPHTLFLLLADRRDEPACGRRMGGGRRGAHLGAEQKAKPYLWKSNARR